MTGNTVLLDIFVPSFTQANLISQGLANDARLLNETVGKENSRVRAIPALAYQQHQSENDRLLGPMKSASTAVFLERIFESTEVMSYDRRVLIANPEWLLPIDQERAKAGYVTEFWHKTRSGMRLLSELFPSHIHTYIGFSSLVHCPDHAKPDYSICGHFGGKAMGRRHTQELMDIWSEDPHLPALSVHFYSDKTPTTRDWLHSNNIRLKLGFMPEEEYLREFSRHGIHICTSSAEGFGHHINEARAIGALIITLDAPPMNELIDSSSGVLAAYTSSSPHCCGHFYKSTAAQLKAAITLVKDMSLDEREALGRSAKHRYLSEREAFFDAMRRESIR